jgi:single-strand DNA-binding protein
MINRVVLVGRLTRDPELRKTQTGKSVSSFTIAINRGFGDNAKTDFIRCVAWEKTADILTQYTKKGSLIGLDGRIQSGEYDDKDGKRVYTQDVVVDTLQLLESKSSATSKPAYDDQYQVAPDYNDYNDKGQDDGPVLDISSDDLPF